MPEKIELIFSKHHETENTIVFKEDLNKEGMPPKIKTIYLQKWACVGLNNPEKISITIKAK